MPVRTALVAVALALGLPAEAQRIQLTPDLAIEPSGGIQPRVSVGVEDPDGADEARYGFGLRRARLQARLLYRDRAGVEYDVDAASGTVQSVDLFGFVNLSKRVQARLGWFVVAQPRAHIGTPYFLIDAVDRAVIAERWAGQTLGGAARDFGADVRYVGDRAEVELAVHNGTGTFSRATGNYSESISGRDVVNGPETQGLAVTTAARVTPGSGVEVGAFAGANAAEGERTARLGEGRSYVTGGAHLYWGAEPGSQPVRLKIDALGIQYEEVGGQGQQVAGLSGLGAIGVLGAGEVFARAERYWADVEADGETFVTAGLSYSPSAAVGQPYHHRRLTLAYSYRDGLVDDAHLVVLQGQIAF